MCVSVHVCEQYVHVSLYVCVCAHVCMCVHVRLRVCVRAYSHTDLSQGLMSQWVKALTAKPNGVSLMQETHTMEGEN